MTWRERFGALSGGTRVAIVATAVVALGSGILSWSANTWAAGEIGIDPWAQWVYGVVIDGAIAAGTAAIFELEGRQRLVAWGVLLSALSVAVVDNGAHAHGGSWLHTVGATVPALLLALCLLVVELLARTPQRSTRAAESSPDRPRVGEGTAPPTYPPPNLRDQVHVLVTAAGAAGLRLTGKDIAEALGMSSGHARKLRAQVVTDG